MSETSETNVPGMQIVYDQKVTKSEGCAKWKFTIRDDRLRGICISSVILMEKDGRQWISLPSIPKPTREGTKYFPMVWFADNEIHRAYKDEILACVQKFLEKKTAPERQLAKEIAEEESFLF